MKQPRRRNERGDLAADARLMQAGRTDTMEYMTTREKVIQVVQDLPEDATVEDAMERLLLLAKIERGIQQSDSGQTVAHADVKERMAKWLK